MFVIGLVGGIAAGKTHVAKLLEEMGAKRIDADGVGHDILTRPLIARRVGQIFGEEVLNPRGSVDREQLGRLVFDDDQTSMVRRKELEALIHPLIHADVVKQLRKYQESQSPPPAVVLDAPLLLEAGWAPACHVIIFIDTPEAIRISRAKERGWTAKKLASRENAQMPLDQKRMAATHVVDGSGSAATLRQQLETIWNQF